MKKSETIIIRVEPEVKNELRKRFGSNLSEVMRNAMLELLALKECGKCGGFGYEIEGDDSE